MENLPESYIVVYYHFAAKSTLCYSTLFRAYKILFANQHSSTVSAEENKSKKEEKERTM